MNWLICSIGVSLCLCTWSCTSPDGNARRDAAAALSDIRAAGIDVCMETRAEHFCGCPTQSGTCAISIVISANRVVVALNATLAARLGLPEQSRAVRWSTPFLRLGDNAGAERAAAYGLMVDLMMAGIIAAKPVPPMLPAHLGEIRNPSSHGVSGALIVLLTALTGGYIAYRHRKASNAMESRGDGA